MGSVLKDRRGINHNGTRSHYFTITPENDKFRVRARRFSLIGLSALLTLPSGWAEDRN